MAITLIHFLCMVGVSHPGGWHPGGTEVPGTLGEIDDGLVPSLPGFVSISLVSPPLRHLHNAH